MQKESLSDALIEYLKTEASFPLFFPPRLRGSCANLFLDVIRHQGVTDPHLVIDAITHNLARKRIYRVVESIFMARIDDSYTEAVSYAQNRILWDTLSPEEKKLSRTATAKMMHVKVMRQEIEHQKSIIMQ